MCCRPSSPTPASVFSLLKTICGQFFQSPRNNMTLPSVTGDVVCFFLEGNENLTAFCCILSPSPANYYHAQFLQLFLPKGRKTLPFFSTYVLHAENTFVGAGGGGGANAPLPKSNRPFPQRVPEHPPCLRTPVGDRRS